MIKPLDALVRLQLFPRLGIDLVPDAFAVKNRVNSCLFPSSNTDVNMIFSARVLAEYCQGEPWRSRACGPVAGALKFSEPGCHGCQNSLMRSFELEPVLPLRQGLLRV